MKMKKVLVYFRPIVALVAALLLANSPAWAADGKGIAVLNTAVNGGNGVAYVAISGNTMGTKTSETQNSGTLGNQPKSFDIVAIPNRGYEFEKWTLSGNGNPGFTSGSTTTPSGTIQMNTGSPVNFIWHVDGTNTATATAKFKSAGAAFNVKYAAAENGDYTIVGPSGSPAYGSPVEGNNVSYITYTGDPIKLTATPAPGYTFIRYYTIDGAGNVKTLGELYKTEQQTVNIKNLDDYSGTIYVCAEFSNRPFAIGERTFETLDAATQAVASLSNKTILVINDATIGAGNYTIPAGVTLLVPKDRSSITPTTTVFRTLDTSPTPSCYRTLTLAEGANIIVNGAIEVGGTQSAGAQGANGAGIPLGKYGKIAMVPGSKIVFNNNAKLYAWGFITGDGSKDLYGKYLSGEIDVRNGATVYEQFQMYDWKGGSHSAGLLGNGKGVFPVNQYFIQNVEVPTTYHPGSALKGMTSIAVSNIEISGFSYSKTTIIINCDQIGIVGEKGTTSMFLMDSADPSEDTWVRKWYDVQHDKQVYEVNSSAELGGMQITMAGVPILGDLDFNSEDYTLPVTNNLKIHLLDGTLDITQNTVLLPGAEIEINKTATVAINSEKNLYLYDAEEWGKYVFSDAYAQHVLYSPSIPADATHGNQHVPTGRAGSWSGSGASAKYVLSKPASAAMNVHGTFDVKGALYTTAGGANIYSSIEDAGTVKFTSAAAGLSKVYQPSKYTVQTTDMIIVELPAASKIDYADASCTSAKLTNDAGSTYSDGDGFTETAGTDAGQSFCFLDINKNDGGKGEWVSLTTDGCFVYDGEGTYYAKPADYVALANGKTENADHTYSSADDTRLFILIGDCQWWEVTYHEQSGLFYCDKNKTYYYYDDSHPNPNVHEWKEKMCTITWQDWNGEILKDEHNKNITYLVPYGSMPKYNNSTPSRQDDPGYYKYDFTGWAPAFAPVTADVTYVAQYERNPVMYTITWQNANGTEREVDYFQRDEMPVCRTQPADMSALEWRPAVAAVTGNATYRLCPKDNVGPYDIKFVNWNGEQIGTTQSVAKGNMPNVPADPTKQALDDVEFIFAGWSPEVVAATAAATYTATFTEQPITYTILWKNYDGATLETDENVAPNAVPQYNGATPTKPSDDEYHYQFAGWNTEMDGSGDEVGAATAGATYYAQYNAIPKDKIVTGDNKTFNMEPSTQITVTNFIVKDDGTSTIPSTSRIDADNFIIEATATTSGQLIVSTGMSINATNYYFDFKVNAINHLWYAVAVPWQVDAQTGISVNGKTLVLGKDFDIVYYNGAQRASVGKQKCWRYVEDDIIESVENGEVLQPGRLYMIGLMMDAPTIRFAKKAGASILTTTTSVEVYPSDVATDANWNGVANPALFHAFVNAGTTAGQVYISAEKRYEPFTMNSDKLVVGQGAFVQAPADKSIVVNTSDTYPSSAPRRARAEEAPLYDVRIAPAEGNYTDRLFVRVEDEKEADKYVIGKDLAKLGVSKSVAQMWINRYNTELCMNTMTMENGAAEYPLGIFAPKAGEYTITNEQSSMSNEYTLYLTFNGEAIWNLSDAAYTGTFDAGTTSAYGLRISARAPQITTGIDEAVVDAKGETRKVLIDNQVFIIRGENVYSVDGQLVK